MRGRASLFRRQKLPTSLMHRLDFMQHLALEAAARAEGRMPGALVVYRPLPPPRPPRLSAQAIVLTWFSLGVLTSGAIGAGTFLGLRAIADGGPLMTWAAWAKPPSAASVPGATGAGTRPSGNLPR
jgi:hypothetical protein